jgi:carboxypeptidase Q
MSRATSNWIVKAFALFATGWLTNSAAAQSTNESPPQALASAASLNLEPYREIVRKITASTMSGNDAWKKLEQLCDDIGHRLSGSPQLDQAIQWALDTMKREGHENVRAEPVMVPRWVRGKESAVMIRPRTADLFMLGLGGSVGTPPEGITAEVVSVRDEAELAALGDRARGKIILFDNPMPAYTVEQGAQYGTSVRFRGRGASLATERGAVACLVRSVTARSLRSPHTGAMRYADNVPKIPAAAISIEDAALISRFQARGIPVVVTLKMEAQTLDPAPSANVVAELRGWEKPEEIVLISGHLDAWDVGTGAHDDGGGCVQAMEAIQVLRRMDLRPRRTIRVVLWTNEENGLAGARQYLKDHEAELANHVAAIESDGGSFRPTGYSIECKDEQRQNRAVEQMRDILSLLAPLGPLKAVAGGSGADIGPMKPFGVMLMGHNVEGSTYFDFHHSHADTLDKVDPTELSQNVAVMAVVSYVLADMPDRIGDQPTTAVGATK